MSSQEDLKLVIVIINVHIHLDVSNLYLDSTPFLLYLHTIFSF